MKLHDTILMGWDSDGELQYVKTFNQHHKKWKLDKAHSQVAASYSRVAMYHISYFDDVKVKEEELSKEERGSISFPGRSFYKSTKGEVFNFDHSIFKRLDTIEQEKILKSLAEMAAKELKEVSS